MNETMKEIMLICEPPFFNSVDVKVCDFPGGFDPVKIGCGNFDESDYRIRCKVTVEFAKSDIEILKKQGLDKAAALKHYKDWLYTVVKVHIASDWICVRGYEDVMSHINEKLDLYYAE